jgi:hypothetical protein
LGNRTALENKKHEKGAKKNKGGATLENKPNGQFAVPWSCSTLFVKEIISNQLESNPQ